MTGIKLHAVCADDAHFLFSIMNTDTILDALNEVSTQLCDWKDAIQEWSNDNDEENYIIRDGEISIGWLGINGLSATDNNVYLKMAVILPDYHNKGIGHYCINQIIEMLKQRNYKKIILYTNQENHKAKACYGKCGFKITETFTEEMSNGEIVSRCKMELELYK